MADNVLIEGLAVETVVGVYDWEREVTQSLVVDLEMAWDNRVPGRTDDVADAMDQHFREAPLAKNLPVVMAMLGIWYTNFWAAETHAILPYDHYLRSLPDHLQQLDMESNGKFINRQGARISYKTGPVISVSYTHLTLPTICSV